MLSLLRNVSKTASVARNSFRTIASCNFVRKEACYTLLKSAALVAQGPRFNSTNATDKKVHLELLREEIKLEKESHNGTLPTISGFDVSAEDASVKLVKKIGNETLTVEFITASTYDMDASEMGDEEQGSEQMQMPWECSALVKLVKPGHPKALAFRVEMLENYPAPDGEEIEGITEPTIQITEVSMLDGPSSEWKNNSYSVDTNTLDEGVYNMFEDMLAERGITPVFVSQLMAFHKDFEHGMYIKTLESFHDFIKSD